MIGEKIGSSTSVICNIRNKELHLRARGKQPITGKELYSMYYIGKMDYPEIAEKTGLPLNKVSEYIGKHLMSLCRQDKSCPYKALLPEYNNKL